MGNTGTQDQAVTSTPLIGLVADQGVTDNYANLMLQLNAIAAAGGGFAVVPYSPQYVGVGQDVIPPQGVWLAGQGPQKAKNLGNTGHSSFGSAIGPAHGAVFALGVIQLVNPGCGLKDLTVIGAIQPFYASSAPAAVYLSGSSGNTASRIKNCTIWGGTSAALYCDGNANDFYIDDTQVINNIGIQTDAGCTWANASQTILDPSAAATIGGQSVIGAGISGSNLIPAGATITAFSAGVSYTISAPTTGLQAGGVALNINLHPQTISSTVPAGLSVFIAPGANDIRFSEVQTFGAPNYIAGSDTVWVGGHMSADTVASTSSLFGGGANYNPLLFLNASGGGVFDGVTIDNGASALVCSIYRASGHWLFSACRFQNGAGFPYPVFQSMVDNGAGVGTDKFNGLEVDGCLISNQTAFSCLINYVYTTAPTNGALDSVVNLRIGANGIAGGANLATLWLNNGAAPVAPTIITPATATGITWGNNGTVQPQIGIVNQQALTTATPGAAATQNTTLGDTFNTATVTTAITGAWSLKVGPTGAITQTVAGGAGPGPVLGSTISFELPANWWYQFAWTAGAVSVATRNA